MQQIGIESSLVKEVLEERKTIEGRLGKPKFLKIVEGDRLSVREDVWESGEIVRSVPDVATIEITQVLYFENFTEMLEAVDYVRVIPTAKTAREAINVYAKFYSEDDEIEYGVVAFEFRLLKKV